MEPQIEETIKAYDLNAEKFSKAYNLSYIRKQLNFYLDNFVGEKILDVGCGAGRDSCYFEKRGFDVIGIDLSEELLKTSRKNASASKFYKMDMRKLGFKPESFDGLWACASFIHVPKKDAYDTLKGFNQVLKPKGLMFLCVKEGKGEIMEKNNTFQEEGRFTAFYSKEEIDALIEITGFEILDSEREVKPLKTWINVFCNKK